MTSMGRRITQVSLTLAWVLFGAGPLAVAGQQPKYGVTVKVSKPAALAKVKTYLWTPSQPSFDKDVDRQIVAAVDRELAARGLTRVESGAHDVAVTYGSLGRTDVDLKAEAKDGARPQYAVGTLVVDLRNPANRQSWFRVRMDTPIDKDPVKLEAAINAAVAAMFAKYPVASKR